MLFGIKNANIFSRSLDFSLVKCHANLILRVFKKDTYKYQAGAVLQKLTREEARIPHAYFQKLVLLSEISRNRI